MRILILINIQNQTKYLCCDVIGQNPRIWIKNTLQTQLFFIQRIKLTVTFQRNLQQAVAKK